MDENKNKLQAEVLESNENDTKNEENIIKEDIKKEGQKKKKDNKKKQGKHNKSNNKFIIILSVIITIILILGILLSTIFALLNSNNKKMLSGVYIGETLIEGLTIEESRLLLQENFEQEKTREIVLLINGDKYTLTPEQIEVEYYIEDAIQEAYNIGRSGNIFKNNFDIIYTMFEKTKIKVEISFNEELLEDVLAGYNAKLANVMLDNTYCIEEDELIITRGTDGIVIDIDSAKDAIIENIKNGNTDEVEIKTVFVECPEIDIEKIHMEVKSEPQNATYTTDPFQVIPHKNGLDFNLDEARQIISEEKEEYVINLIVTEPDIKTNEIGEEAFPDLLSSFSTKYDESNISRSKNLKLATQKLDGVVIMPGEVFSYNETLGKRTAEAGYEYANGFAGGKVVPMLAGGICQISSTLYDAVLYANLNIVERYNHMFQATYVDPGKDATVVYGSLDFKFENTRSYPIMLKAKASGGLAEIKIFGIRENVEYEIEIITEVLSYTPYNVVKEKDFSLAPGQEKVTQWGLQGCKSITYRIVKLNGKEISREVLSTDTYSPLNKIVKVGPSATVDTSTTPETSKPEENPELPVETTPENSEEINPGNPEENTPENSEEIKPEISEESIPEDTEEIKPENSEEILPEDKEENVPEETEQNLESEIQDENIKESTEQEA